MNGSPMSCDDVRDRISPHVEGKLHPTERASMGEHLLRCGDCRRLRDDVASLVDDLKLLAGELTEPAGLSDRIAGSVAPPVRASRVPPERRAANTVALRRAAAWAVVFLGAWIQFFGPQVAALAADELAPAAGTIVAEVKERGLRARVDGEELLDDVGRARADIRELSRDPMQILRPLWSGSGTESAAPATQETDRGDSTP